MLDGREVLILAVYCDVVVSIILIITPVRLEMEED